MKDLLLYIARNLVEDPDAVSVTEIEGDQELTLELRVAPDETTGRAKMHCKIRLDHVSKLLHDETPSITGCYLQTGTWQ